MYYVVGFSKDKSRVHIRDTKDGAAESFRVSDIPKLGVKVYGIDGDNISVFGMDAMKKYAERRMTQDKLMGIESNYEVKRNERTGHIFWVEYLNGVFKRQITSDLIEQIPDYAIELTDCKINTNITNYPVLDGTRRVMCSIPSQPSSRAEYAFTKSTGTFGVSIPSSCKTIYGDAFKKTKVTNVTIAGKCKINDACFKECTSLTKVMLHKGADVKAKAFSGCSQLSEVVGSDSITSVSMASFLGCSSLTTIDLSGLKSVDTDLVMDEEGVFEDCTALQEVIWSPSIRLTDRCFRNCKSLKTIYNVGDLFGSSKNYAESQAFEGCDNLREIVVSDESAVESVVWGLNSIGFTVKDGGDINGEPKKSGVRLLLSS